VRLFGHERCLNEWLCVPRLVYHRSNKLSQCMFQPEASKASSVSIRYCSLSQLSNAKLALCYLDSVTQIIIFPYAKLALCYMDSVTQIIIFPLIPFNVQWGFRQYTHPTHYIRRVRQPWKMLSRNWRTLGQNANPLVCLVESVRRGTYFQAHYLPYFWTNEIVTYILWICIKSSFPTYMLFVWQNAESGAML
jgi:hypothetical protein